MAEVKNEWQLVTNTQGAAQCTVCQSTESLNSGARSNLVQTVCCLRLLPSHTCLHRKQYGHLPIRGQKCHSPAENNESERTQQALLLSNLSYLGWIRKSCAELPCQWYFFKRSIVPTLRCLGHRSGGSMVSAPVCKAGMILLAASSRKKLPSLSGFDVHPHIYRLPNARGTQIVPGARFPFS